MATLDREGVRLHYEVAGSGPTVLLSHGYSATLRMWWRQVEPLSREHRLVRWDMRGHGESDAPDDPAAYSVEATVADMAAILDELGAEQAVVGGLSLGGYVSLAFHLAHPERVRALMLFDTGPGYRKDAPREAWNQMALERAKRLEGQGFEALGRGAEVVGSAHRSPQGLAHAARGILVQREARVIDSLPSIGVPTLVLVGEKDERFHAATDYMADRIPGATKVVVPGAGHAANIDRPEEFDAAVLDFLASL